jgi:ATP-dependent helicase HrpA
MAPTELDAALDDRLRALMVRDEHRLRRRIDGHAGRRGRGRGRPGRGGDIDLTKAIEAAETRVLRRRALLPEPRYPEGLPVVERRDDLLAVIGDHQVVVVAGETGSGKSTQLPKLCLELGRGVRGLVGHTQPRRLAARTVSERIADELGTTVGGLVGYTVRFIDKVGDGTLVKVMTDGILLNEIQRDRLLTHYDTLIIDEAHERSLNIDFILGYLRQLLPQRPDLKVIITSATIDTERFSAHFDGAPVVEVTGRSFPVEMRYRPIGEEPDDDRDQTQAVCDTVVELAAEGRGDVLVFLSGEREIRDTADALSRVDLRSTEILPLYARLSAAEQHRAFEPHPGRRIVLATNVAETSITVPGIRYVVDAGTARISRYNRRTKVQRLPIEAVSQASANQRAGRCGRVAPGVCIRLYAEDDYLARPEFTEPEILRTNLASVILQMAALGLGDVAAFPFVDPPDARSITDGIALLDELGALVHRPGAASVAGDERTRLTTVGRQLAALPLDPRLGRMVLEADRNGCVADVLVIAAGLAIQDVRERPTGKEQAAAESHKRFADGDSDFVALLELWRYLRAQQRELGSSRFRKLCKAEYLHHLRVREWQDVHGQLRQIATRLGLDTTGETAAAGSGDRDRIHLSLLPGLLTQVGVRDGDTQEYLGTRSSRFAIAPGSPLAKTRPRWVMAAELVETNRLLARTVARIHPEWVERLGAHLMKRSYGEQWWDEKRGTAMTTETVTLHGVPVVSGRPVALSTVDPEGARVLFVRHALLDGEWEAHHAFIAANAAAVAEVRALEDRVRRHDLLADEELRYDFFDERVPLHVTSTRHFDRWWKGERQRRPQLLDLTADVLVDPDAGDVSAAAFPDRWRVGDLSLALTYVFDPASPIDGVMVDVPLEVLHRVGPADFDWHVPGFQAELVAALIRSLPKGVRRGLGPVGEHARAFLDIASPGDGALLDVLAAFLAPRAATAVRPADFDLGRVPAHLQLTFRVIGPDGSVLDADDDLGGLVARLGPQVRAAIADAAPELVRTGLTTWDVGTLPSVVRIERAGVAVSAYPALVDEGATVGVGVLPRASEQTAAMWAGTRRLLLISAGVSRKAVQRQLGNETALALALSRSTGGGGGIGAVLDDCITASVDRLLGDAGGPAWDEAGFAALQRAVRDGLLDTAARAATIAGGVLATVQRVEDRLTRLTAPSLDAAVLDVRAHLARLVPRGFVIAGGARRLPDLLRYVRAIERRLDRLTDDPARDRRLLAGIRRLEADYEHLLETLPADRLAELGALHWQLEELRVATFAQSIGPKGAVSEARIRKELSRLAAGAP